MESQLSTRLHIIVGESDPPHLMIEKRESFAWPKLFQASPLRSAWERAREVNKSISREGSVPLRFNQKRFCPGQVRGFAFPIKKINHGKDRQLKLIAAFVMPEGLFQFRLIRSRRGQKCVDRALSEHLFGLGMVPQWINQGFPPWNCRILESGRKLH